jgi:tRNA threonylcarbamoyladenosine biosynthesis protein TsaE
MDVKIHLTDTDQTLVLGQTLAKNMAKSPFLPALLLQGNLGSGKTTLVRGLVESLPGAEQAEVSSPSFNIYNFYPTTPPVAHFDLYRLEGMPPDDALYESLDDPGTLTIVEWIQFLDRAEWPDNAVYLKWLPSEKGRSLTLNAIGETAENIVRSVLDQFTF